MTNMRMTEGAASSSHKSSRDNNLNILRLMATVFIFTGHLGQICGMEAPSLGRIGLHELGVLILFFISGYLITMSWISDSNVKRYAIRRFFRLWPPFAVMILLVVFVFAPLCSDLGILGYFRARFWPYLANLGFYPVYSLPGLFLDLPVYDTVNGSLWTMPVEVMLYVLTPILVIAFRVKAHSRASFYRLLTLIAAGLCVECYFRTIGLGTRAVFYAVDWVTAFHVILPFLMGVLFTYDEVKKYLNLQAACVLLCVQVVLQNVGVGPRYLLLYLILPYVVFSFAFAPKPVFSKVCTRIEPSFGIYLYGFFFQQQTVSWMMHHNISLTYMKALVISAVPTIILAVLSSYLIEKPALRFGRALTEKLKAREMAGTTK